MNRRPQPPMPSPQQRRMGMPGSGPIPGGMTQDLQPHGLKADTTMVDRRIKKPSDKRLPPRVYETLPDAKLFNQMLETERKLDITLARKRLDLSDTLSRVKKTETVRVFISNTWEPPLPSADFIGGAADEEGTYELKIEGRLVDDVPADDPNRRRFSSLFTSIIVELITPSEVAAAASAAAAANASAVDGVAPLPVPQPQPQIVEWHEPVKTQGSTAANGSSTNVEFDVLDIKRKSNENVNVRILFQPKEYLDKYVLSPELSSLLAIKEESKPGVVLAMWQYIKFHKLQDQNERRLIRCDRALKDLFKVDQINFPQILELIQPHLQQRPPIVIEHVVVANDGYAAGDASYDLELNVVSPEAAEVAEELAAWNTDQAQKIQDLDSKITLLAQALRNATQRTKFFTELATDPKEFVTKWVDSQSRDLSVIGSERGFSEEEVRKSGFYTDELLAENVHLFVNTKR